VYLHIAKAAPFAEAYIHGFGITVFAPWAYFVAPGYGVPGVVGPLNGSFVHNSGIGLK